MGRSRVADAVDAVDDETLMTPDEVAAHLRISTAQLAQMRYEGRGPVFVKLSGKGVRYSRRDVRAFVQGQRRAGTSDAVPLPD
jgi:hypothetical protein